MKGLLSLFLVLALAAPLALAQKSVIVIRETNDEYDQVYLDMLSSVGVTTSDGVFVAGLGYTVIEKDANDYTEETFTSADGNLILILESSIASAPNAHANDPLPLVSMESLIMSNGAVDASMWFQIDRAVDNDIAGKTGVTITDITHPITSVFELGELAMWTIGGDYSTDVRALGGTIAEGVQSLAHGGGPEQLGKEQLGKEQLGKEQLALGVVETGTILTGAPSDISPTPERRAFIGVNGESYMTVTAAGVVLFQRTIQWTMGEKVTAVVPTAKPEVEEVKN